MTDDDLKLFEREMVGVRPLKRQDTAVLPAKPPATPGQVYRRQAAQRSLGKDENFLPAGFIEPVDPHAVLSFKQHGVQHGVFHSLQQGRYPIEATLDLHLMSMERARVEVFEFIRDCVRLDVRTALINHGKSERRDSAQAVMKSCIARWLPMFAEVIAFHSAQRFHGGAGAVYVMLRKSEKAKEQTRERLGLKSESPMGEEQPAGHRHADRR